MFIIKKPIITEKSLRDARMGVYTFAVEKKATKKQVKEAIENIFKVHVKSITSTIVKGKKRLAGRRRIPVYKPDIKKARVELEANEKIDLFEVGEKK